MIAFIVVLALFATLGVAPLLGLTVDSRDHDYDLGPVFDPRPAPFTSAPGR